VPSLLHRCVLARLALTAPAGNFKLRSPRVEAQRMGAVFHKVHGWFACDFAPQCWHFSASFHRPSSGRSGYAFHWLHTRERPRPRAGHGHADHALDRGSVGASAT
jgi:hypothetical protein